MATKKPTTEREGHQERNAMSSKPTKVFPSATHITQKILILRGRRVLLDRDLAEIYGVSAGRLNEAVKRNIRRFPEDFMFQLTAVEAEASRSQNAILKTGRGANIKYLPYAFTEHGAIQAANILKSERAIEMGIYVVRAFVHLRELIASNAELARQIKVLETRVKRKFATHDQTLTGILKTIRELMNPPVKKSRPIGFTANLQDAE